MTRTERAQRAAYGLAILAALLPLCPFVMAAVGVWRLATRASRRERRLAQSRAIVQHATAVAAREADAFAAVERIFNPVHIPAQRSAS